MFHWRGKVLRTLDRQACAALEEAFANGLLPGLMRDGLVPQSRLSLAADLGLDPAFVGEIVVVQERVKVVTYPYEWSFEMLRDAALVTLEVQRRCLSHGFSLKDGTSYNVLFDGNRPVFIDLGSLEPRPGDVAWSGYGQFCRAFLFPLLLSAHRGLDFQRVLRGYMGEIPVRDAWRMLGWTKLARPGVLKDVALQAMLERSFASRPEGITNQVKAVAVPVAFVDANAARLQKIVQGLRSSSGPTEWGRYESSNTYGADDVVTKKAFVDQVVAVARPDRVVDLGSNTGTYSEVAALHARHVISVDVDPEAIDRMYRRLGPRVPRTVLVADLADPSPGMGWGLRERSSLRRRIEAEFFLALALVHHLRIGRNVPLDMVVAELAEAAAEGVVEWVDRGDPMVDRLLANRQDVFRDYGRASFESLLSVHFEVVGTADTHGGRRRLYHVRRRPRNRPREADGVPSP